MSAIKHLPRILRAVAAAIPLLAACGSSPPVSYYSLEALETDYRRDTGNALIIGAGPLRTPDYLSRSRIVTRGDDGSVFIDEFNRWAEPVDDAVYRIVSLSLDTLLEDAVVIGYPYTHVANIDYQLIGRIDRFGADHDGRVELRVQWAVTTPNGDMLVSPKRATYEARANPGRDYPSIARAMSEALQAFSRDVATAIEAALADRT
jgi:uncharacterized lipoprotein YmbA